MWRLTGFNLNSGIKTVVSHRVQLSSFRLCRGSVDKNQIVCERNVASLQNDAACASTATLHSVTPSSHWPHLSHLAGVMLFYYVVHVILASVSDCVHLVVIPLLLLCPVLRVFLIISDSVVLRTDRLCTGCFILKIDWIHSASVPSGFLSGFICSVQLDADAARFCREETYSLWAVRSPSAATPDLLKLSWIFTVCLPECRWLVFRGVGDGMCVIQPPSLALQTFSNLNLNCILPCLGYCMLQMCFAGSKLLYLVMNPNIRQVKMMTAWDKKLNATMVIKLYEGCERLSRMTQKYIQPENSIFDL